MAFIEDRGREGLHAGRDDDHDLDNGSGDDNHKHRGYNHDHDRRWFFYDFDGSKHYYPGNYSTDNTD